MADTTRYNIDFVAPQLPAPPVQYDTSSFNKFNSVLNIYFAQLDRGIRNASTAPQAEATGWFFS
jgi:hypothetical protein